MTDDLIARAEEAYAVRLLPNGRDELLGDLIAALRAANARADAAEAKLAEAVEQNTRLQTAIIASAKIGQIIGFLGDDEGRIEAFREACGPELLSKARATLAKIGGEG
jgi:hypothetical protein